MSLINISITMDEAVKSAIVKHDKSGKSFLNLVVQKRKEVGTYGDTHYITLQQTKEEREAKADKVFVGSGKEWIFEDRKVTPPVEEEDDSLPF